MSTYPPDLAQYIETKVASGAFRSQDEFAIEACVSIATWKIGTHASSPTFGRRLTKRTAASASQWTLKRSRPNWSPSSTNMGSQDNGPRRADTVGAE